MTILPTLLSTALFFTSALPAPSASQAAKPHVVFTQVLPDESLVAYHGTMLKVTLPKPSEPEEQVKLVEAKPSAEAIMPIVQAASAQISTSPVPTSAATTPSTYEGVYKEAGAKYGVPWQVLYGIHMTETGGRNGAISSGHGPQGPMQFMPGTFNAYAVDGNGDGTADINDATDAIYTAANYMAKHGSLESGLRSYGGNTTGTLRYAHEKGFNQ